MKKVIYLLLATLLVNCTPKMAKHNNDYRDAIQISSEIVTLERIIVLARYGKDQVGVIWKSDRDRYFLQLINNDRDTLSLKKGTRRQIFCYK